MNTCETCKNWKKYTEEFDVKYHGDRAGLCNSEKFTYSDNPPEKGLAYWDSENCGAGFNTDKCFGCVNWEAKE
jgi:hypothetical protein